MKPSKILLASVFLTVIIIVVIGAVTWIVMANNASTTPGAETVQVYRQREAGYNQLIQQANQQIEEANARLQAAQSQQAQPHSTAGGAAGPAAGAVAGSNTLANAAVTADKAEQLARQAADPAQLVVKKPELVNFEGKVAYEVAFQKGSIYLDAQTGAVLFNGTIPQKISLDKAAQTAADYLKDNNILQADQITFRNVPLYRVIFKSGMMVYLDTTGQITYILKSSSKVVVIDAPSHSSSSPSASQPSLPPTENEEDGGGNAGGEN